MRNLYLIINKVYAKIFQSKKMKLSFIIFIKARLWLNGVVTANKRFYLINKIFKQCQKKEV